MAEGTVIDRTGATTHDDATKGAQHPWALVAELQCMNEPGFIEWFELFVSIVKDAEPDTPLPEMVRRLAMHAPVSPEWAEAAKCFMLMHMSEAQAGGTMGRAQALASVKNG